MLPTLYKDFRVSSFIDEFEREWFKTVDNFFQPSHVSELRNRLKNNSNYPKWDVYSTDDSYRIQASVPGVNPEDLKVEIFTDDTTRYVRLSGQMSEEHQERGATWQVKELKRGAFSRVDPLPDGLDGDPEARIKDGIVTLCWAKPKEVAKRQDTKVIQLKRE